MSASDHVMARLATVRRSRPFSSPLLALWMDRNCEGRDNSHDLFSQVFCPMTFTHRPFTDGDRISVINRPEMTLFDSYRRLLHL
jgi:hypothetical protein